MSKPRYFGTDGLRGVANAGMLSPENVLACTGGSQMSSALNSPSSFQTVVGVRSTTTSREAESWPSASAVLVAMESDIMAIPFRRSEVMGLALIWLRVWIAVLICECDRRSSTIVFSRMR